MGSAIKDKVLKKTDFFDTFPNVKVKGNERGMIINKVSVASETKIQNHLSCDNNRGRRITI